MRKFEHTRAVFTLSSTPEEEDHVKAMFNATGEDGWELVSVITIVNQPNRRELWFKREIIE